MAAAPSDTIICIGSIECANTQNLEKQPLNWIRFKIICEADGRTLWHDGSCRTVADVASIMKDNDIKYHSIANPEPGVFIVRAHAASLAELKDWPADEMCVRTFYTLQESRQSRRSESEQRSGEDKDKNDLFNTDSCWLAEGLIELKTVADWYRMISQMEIRG